MSKLFGALEALIDAPFARAGTTPAPRRIGSIYENITRKAASHRVEQPTWLAMTTAATMTMSSPESLTPLHCMASAERLVTNAIKNAELMREARLKCIGFNGVPRTINYLNAFRGSLPEEVGAGLTTQPSRTPSAGDIKRRGRALWDSIYRPFETKLVEKLAHSHPDLPVHIINSEYEAVACLRAQTGAGPQVTSHLFGMLKALDDGTWKDCMWILERVGNIVQAIGGSQGSTFAPPRAKI
ncbi:uncharacterized protein BDR25DRAFT_334712 [Lindgomyces ingoldianus]|uniref:Uncharacterized protein n=1 Tax=Lindgomyces ingoldianus TaxID=673940 RepID=A0ACB6QRV3_9PLEO|nr:uncharacterized protein BDR25DRAFT_334712 [Lindgomyces ingoldianus]KAF2469743.1 hypothetical protein BDR25DRAFT_334712 [Lindgomyces ingoldianus]